MLLRGGGDYELYNGTVAGFGSCVDIDGAQTIRAANAALDEKGPPVWQSVYLTCANAFKNDSDVNAASARQSFDAGSNNTANGTSTLSAIFINGANETAVTPFAVKAVNSYFTDTNYIGAVKDANDTRFQGWTCGLYTGSCGTAPTVG